MQEQNTMLPATARTWTAWYGVECTYHGHGLLQIQLGQDKSFFHQNASLYSEEYLNEEMRTLLEAGGEGGGVGYNDIYHIANEKQLPLAGSLWYRKWNTKTYCVVPENIFIPYPTKGTLSKTPPPFKSY